MKFEKLLPHFGIVVGFFIVAALFFRPIVFDGKSLTEHDNVQARGMQTEIQKYKKEEGKAPLWTNQVFIGMPTYQLYGSYNNNFVAKAFFYIFRFGQSLTTPHIVMFLMMLLGYIALLVLKVDMWSAAVGALIIGLLTNNIVLYEAGHSVKIHAMAYVAPVLAGTVAALKGRFLIGGVLTAMVFSAQTAGNHLQITYYTMLLMGIIGLAMLVDAFLHKKLMTVVKGGTVIVVAVLLGLGSNLSMLWTTYQYTQESTRGKSELTTYKLEESDLNTLVGKGLTQEEKQRLANYQVAGKGVKTKEFFLSRAEAALGAEKFNVLKDDIVQLAETSNNSGLDKSYIFDWSFGKMETFTLMIPHFYGGSNQENFISLRGETKNTNSEAAIKDLLVKSQIPPAQHQQARNSFKQLTSQYWGAQPFTSGPNYLGAIVCFLFFLGAFMVKGPFKWATVIGVMLFIILSWGDNFQTFNYFMVDNFPMYGKFRAVTMTLSVVQMMVVLLAIMGLYQFITYDDSKIAARKRKGFITDKLLGLFKLNPTRVNHLYLAAGVSGAICLVALIYSFTGSFEAPNDYIFQQQYERDNGAQQWLNLRDAVRSDRAALIQSSAFRSLIFILLAAGALWALATQKLKSALLVTGIVGLLAIIDIVLIDRIYINDESFQPKKSIRAKPPATDADKQIMKDKEVHFRVYDGIAGTRQRLKYGQPVGKGSPSQNSEGGFFHKIVGGYHAAKPLLYQELVDCHLNSFSLAKNARILGMLNTKYIIQPIENPDGRTVAAPVPNKDEALGNAWFVQEIEFKETADDEMVGLKGLEPRKKALTRSSNKAYLKGVQTGPLGVSDRINLVSYHPEKMVYESEAEAPRLAVFSEIYYPPAKGWHVYIDGKRASGDFIKVNYLIRGLKVPAGKHKIEFIFEPSAYATGELISLISSLLIFAGLGFAIYFYRRKKMTPEEEAEAYPQEETTTPKKESKEEKPKEEKNTTPKKKKGNSSKKRKKK